MGSDNSGYTTVEKMLTQIKWQSLGFFFVSFIVPIVAFKEFNATGFEMGFLFSLQVFGKTASSPFVGFLSNKVSIRNSITLVGSIIRGIAYIIVYFAIVVKLYPLMILGTLLLGLGAGFLLIPVETMLADAIEYDRRSEFFGKNKQQGGIGVMIGSTLGFTYYVIVSALSENPALKYLPLIFFMIGNLYAGVRMYTIIPSLPVNHKQRVESIETGSSALVRIILIGFISLLTVIFFQSMNGALVAPFLQVFLIDNITDNEGLISVAYAPGAMISLIIAPTLGKLVDKVNLRYWLFGTSMIGALTTFLLINTNSIIIFAILFIIDASVVTSATLVLSKLVSNISADKRGSIFGLKDLVENLGAIGGPILGGAIWEIYGSTGPFIFSIGVEIVIAFVYLSMMPLLLCQESQLKMQRLVALQLNVPPTLT